MRNDEGRNKFRLKGKSKWMDAGEAVACEAKRFGFAKCWRKWNGISFVLVLVLSELESHPLVGLCEM